MRKKEKATKINLLTCTFLLRVDVFLVNTGVHTVAKEVMGRPKFIVIGGMSSRHVCGTTAHLQNALS